MPSHLNEESQEHKRADAIRKGLVTDRDIACNDYVDELAKQGALQHKQIGHLLNAAADRRFCTILVQQMALNIWEEYLSSIEDAKALAAEAEDIAAMESAMNNLEAASHDDAEFDHPFALENSEQFTDTTKKRIFSSGYDDNENSDVLKLDAPALQQKFPNYPWNGNMAPQDRSAVPDAVRVCAEGNGKDSR